MFYNVRSGWTEAVSHSRLCKILDIVNNGSFVHRLRRTVYSMILSVAEEGLAKDDESISIVLKKVQSVAGAIAAWIDRTCNVFASHTAHPIDEK